MDAGVVAAGGLDGVLDCSPDDFSPDDFSPDVFSPAGFESPPFSDSRAFLRAADG